MCAPGNRLPRILALLSLLLPLLAACQAPPRFVILSGSENETLEPLIEEFAASRRVEVELRYKGSVDIMNELRAGAEGLDAVWPANSLWIALGDRDRRVRRTSSVMQSPVAFGIRESLARELGFDSREPAARDILNAVAAGRLRFMMTSATQSNSGASAYLGFLSALAGNPETLSLGDLDKPALREGMRAFLAGVDRSSGSSGWLKELFLSSDYDAMVNYESVLIETNLALIAAGREPLLIIYPRDGTVIADSPLGLLATGDARKESFHKELVDFLLSPAIQKRLVASGRRPAFAGSLALDPSVFRPEWGIDPSRSLGAFRMPEPAVIEKALLLYQTELRKPSFTVFCLDYSGSMAGPGERALEDAMSLLLDRERAAEYLIQPGTADRIVAIPFSGEPRQALEGRGSDLASLELLAARIRSLEPGGNTDIFSPVIEALGILAAEPRLGDYIPAIVLMTDGESNTGKSAADLDAAWRKTGLDIPVFSIAFGGADESQLGHIAALTRARVFDGRSNLPKAFRTVKGYN